jgi:TRAP-type C4-dicarboxylate transport system permease small subunit
MTKLKNILDKCLEVLVMFSVAVLVIDVLWQVATRYGSKFAPWIKSFGSDGQFAAFLVKYTEGIQPSSWTDELATFLLIWVALLGSAVALGRGAHLGIDYFVGKLNDKVRIRTELFVFAVVTLFSLLVMVFGGIGLVARTFELKQVSVSLNMPMGYVYLAVPISGAFLVLYSLIGFFERLNSAKQGGVA